MCRSTLLICLTCGCLTGSVAFAQFGGAMAPTEDLRPIQLEISILDISTPPGVVNQRLTDEQQVKRLERLESERKLAGVQRLNLNLVSNQPTQLQLGETVLVPVGSTRGGFGGRGGNPGNPPSAPGMSTIEIHRNVGTTVQAMAKPNPSGILIDLKIERTGLSAPRADADAQTESPKTRQLSISSVVQLNSEETRVVGGSQTVKGDGTQEEIWVVARASIGPPVESKVPAMTVYTLKFAQAAETVELLRCLFDSPAVRITPDLRTNLIVVVAPDDILKHVEPLVKMLDERAAEQPKPKEGNPPR